MIRSLLPLLLLSCEPFGPGSDSPGPPDGGQGVLRLSADEMLFQPHSVSNEAHEAQSFEVRNAGQGLLKVAGLHRPLGDSDAFTTNAPALFELKPGDTRSIRVEFHPPASGEFEASLLPNGQKELRLKGQGLAPKISLSPNPLLFENQAIGCSDQRLLELQNIGQEDLEISRINISGSQDFIVDGEVPLILSSTETSQAIALFAPKSGGLHQSTLQIESNDPTKPVTAIPLEAIGFEGERIEQAFQYYPESRSDLLFVLNERPSVLNHMAPALEDFENLVESMEAIDWRMTVSNMSTTCTLTPGPWFDTESLASETAEGLFGAFSSSGPGGTELLDKAIVLLERTDPGDCLDGFLRESSQLQLILITDQNEGSSGTVNSLLSELEGQLANNQSIVVSAFSGTGSGGCANSPRLLNATAETSGSHIDLCNEPLSDLFNSLAQTAIDNLNPEVKLELQEVPVASTLEVKSEGIALNNWQYLSSSNTLVLNGNQANLETGAWIEVTYLAAVDCH